MTSQPEKKRVLYFCSRLPSSVQGGLDLRVRGQIQAMLAFAEVSVFGLTGKGEPFDARIHSWQSSRDPVVGRSIGAVAGMVALREGRHPFGSRFSEETAKELRDEIRVRRPDFIVLSRIDLTVYLETIREGFDGTVVLDLDESVTSYAPSILKLMSNPGQRMLFSAFWKSVEAVERAMLTAVDHVWVSSQSEHDNVRARGFHPSGESSQLSVMPNCVAVDTYAKVAAVPREAHTLIYPASFAYTPNMDAARFLITELMPLLPEMKLYFVGSHPPPWLVECNAPNVACIGPVPAIAPYLATASALVLPLWAGAGTRLKAIEALASGLPLVSTVFGVEGLDLVPGDDYLRAESPLEFARQCRKISSDPGLATMLSNRGRKTVNDRFSIEALENRMRSVI